ncbi:MAG: transposase [Planctomycetaceae bacterium]|nr:transposase [Planctomycetaceae bacterium]
MKQKRKRIKHLHTPGDCHELTFSCYQNRSLLTEDRWRLKFCRQLERANLAYQMELIAFVVMPNHVHLLVYPVESDPQIDNYLFAIKRPFSYRIKQELAQSNQQLLEELTIRERPGKLSFGFWQEGPGYDRNLDTEQAVLASIEYLHLNPVRKKFVTQARDWRWSSAQWYDSGGELGDPALPTIHGLQAGFFTEVRD